MVTVFAPIFLLILLAVFGIAAAMVLLSHFLGPRRTTAVKQMPYESGMDPIGDARQRFDVRYYLVAIMFLLFDVELLYLYPWAVAQWSATATADPGAAPGVPATAAAAATSLGIPPAFRSLVFVELLVFVAVLAAAYVYAWKKGVFEWR